MIQVVDEDQDLGEKEEEGLKSFCVETLLEIIKIKHTLSNLGFSTLKYIYLSPPTLPPPNRIEEILGWEVRPEINPDSHLLTV